MRVFSDRQDKEKNIHGHYFLDFSIENVRCYGKKQTISLSDEKGKPYHWTIILGDNGIGKTSILKGLVSLAPSPKLIYGEKQKIKLYPGLLDWAEQWDTRRFDGKLPSHFEANTIAGFGINKLVKDSTIHFQIDQGHESLRDLSYDETAYEKIGDFLCFAYGASRKMSQSSFSGEKYSTASISLFDDEAPLINVEEFFMQADYEAKTSKTSDARRQREKVKALLIDILPEVSDLRIFKTGSIGRHVQVKTPYGWVRISEMSLGYKSLIAWVVDFASRMFHYHRNKKAPFSEPAVVLIDEIDLHLHPKWQRKILGYLSKKFPNTQFIATAHSPLIVQSALEANVVLLKRRGSQVMVENHPDTINNWRIDQILTSDLFGLSSSRSEKAEKLMTQRRNLLLKPKLNKTEKVKLENLEKKMDFVPVAETSEYLEAMQIIKKSSEQIS